MARLELGLIVEYYACLVGSFQLGFGEVDDMICTLPVGSLEHVVVDLISS